MTELFGMANYAQRTVYSIKTIISLIFEQLRDSFDQLLSGKFILKNLVAIFGAICAKCNFHGFGGKLTDYVASNPTDAENAISKISRDIDSRIKNNCHMWRLKQLEKNLLNNFKLYVPDKIFVNQTDIDIKGHSDNRNTLYVLNDIVILVNVQTKGVTVLFDCPANQFHYAMVPGNSLSITIEAIIKSYNKSVINQRK